MLEIWNWGCHLLHRMSSGGASFSIKNLKIRGDVQNFGGCQALVLTQAQLIPRNNSSVLSLRHQSVSKQMPSFVLVAAYSAIKAIAKSHNHRPYHYPPFSPGKDLPYYTIQIQCWCKLASLLASFTLKKDEAKKLTRHIFLIISCASQGNLKLFPYYFHKVLWKLWSIHPQIPSLSSSHP